MLELNPLFSDQSGIAGVTLLALLVELLGILSALEAIFKTRTAQGAIAWAISLVVMPFIMVPLYWIFGRRKFQGYKKALRLGSPQIQLVAAELYKNLATQNSSSTPDEPLVALEKLVQMPFTDGNQIELLIDGQAYFDRLFELIDTAQNYILLEYYILRSDSIGIKLKQKLIEKSQAGVEVYLIYDEIGSLQLNSEYLSELRREGIHVSPFNSTKGWRNRFQLNFRNHRKIAIADGSRAMVGGINIGEEYIAKEGPLAPWRDTNLKISGPAVQSIQLAFLEDWYWSTETIPELNWDIALNEPGLPSLVLATGPADTLDSCALFFLHAIYSAKTRLWIVSPYFVPDPSVISALQLAALRGVDVRILLPEKTDNRLVQLSSYANYRDLLNAGIRLFRYQSGFLHQKVMLIDDRYASIGTANLDNRSFRLNFEITLLIQAEAFAAEVETMLEEDFSQSEEVTYEDYRRQPLYFKLLVRSAYLLAPIQ